MSHVLRKERYSAEVAGLRLTAGNLQALESLVREALGWLLDGQRLPQFWFLVDGRAAVPVFQRVGAYAARVRGGPEIAGPTLAAVREKVGAYQERTDLRVRALSVHDLRYHDAYAIVERGGAWIPIFDEGGKLRTPDLDVRSPQAGLLPFLRALVDAYGPAGPAVHDALVLTCVSEQAWAELLTDRSPSEFALSMPDADARRRISVEVLRLDGRLACSLDGPAEAAGTGATHRVLLAGDVWTLAEVLGRELEQRAVARRDEIRIHRMADAIGGVR